ncbi:hypothetical protein ABZY14_34320 [Streptomyces sp. NPDC006617]|uniref:TRADD-N-associated membrane domain-containing protein n=1 Tax=Streptomyces sp. NPDC006617 TaxID=3155354 RepID=UPI0033B9A474
MEYELWTNLAIGLATLSAMAATIRQWRDSSKNFDKDLKEERQRLREQVAAKELNVGGDLHIHTPTSTRTANAHEPEEVAAVRAALQRVDDDRFAELLIDYYAYGLTQARSSFHTSQRFAGLGTLILLFGIVLAIWRSETTGDLYLGIVTSSVGAVIALIGQLFHRRADIALRHMSEQTESLRDDMRTERSTEQAIMLLADVVDPEVKARLQAGLIMKLAGAELPTLADQVHVPYPRDMGPRTESTSAGE